MPIIPHGAGEGKQGPETSPERASGLLGRIPEGVLTAAVVVLASSGSFGLGIMVGRNGVDTEPVRIEQVSGETGDVLGATAVIAPLSVSKVSKAKKVEPVGTATATTGKYVASKKGTKYHLPTCSGAKTMSEENKIWFFTKEEAEAAGFGPASNCKGL